MIRVPVETALGLSNEPAWLDGYGWIDAPTARDLLVDAELRQVCVQSSSGALVDLAPADVRPPPTPTGVRDALLGMVGDDLVLGDLAFRHEHQHDPSDPLSLFVELRDVSCDGPTGARIPAARCDLDHDVPYPQGPTAAWNLVARSRRTHGLKHLGWTPLRTAESTLWASPCGQLVEVPRQLDPPPGVDGGCGCGWCQDPTLPDPDALALTDREARTANRPDEVPSLSWLRRSAQPLSDPAPTTDAPF